MPIPESADMVPGGEGLGRVAKESKEIQPIGRLDRVGIDDLERGAEPR
jgi:hypothetical protein